jgi:hypothetical protein
MSAASGRRTGDNRTENGRSYFTRASAGKRRAFAKTSNLQTPFGENEPGCH